MRGVIAVTPGYTQPLEFVWGDLDGVPLNLLGLRATLVLWTTDRFPGGVSASEPDGEVLLRKPIEIADPLLGLGSALLTADDTRRVGLAARDAGVSWSVVLHDASNAFLCTATESGSTSGTVSVERTGMPDAQTALGVQ